MWNVEAAQYHNVSIYVHCVLFLWERIHHSASASLDIMSYSCRFINTAEYVPSLEGLCLGLRCEMDPVDQVSACCSACSSCFSNSIWVHGYTFSWTVNEWGSPCNYYSQWGSQPAQQGLCPVVGERSPHPKSVSCLLKISRKAILTVYTVWSGTSSTNLSFILWFFPISHWGVQAG